MDLTEKLKDMGLSEDDLNLVESAMSSRIGEAAEILAKELLEQEREVFESRVTEIEESFKDQFSQYSEAVIAKLDEKYEAKLNNELESLHEQQKEIVAGFVKEFDGYAKHIVESLEDKYKTEFEETAASIVESFKTSFDGYSQHLTEEFKVGAGSQSALRVEMADALIESIRGVYSKFNVQLPEGVDLEQEYDNFVRESEQNMKELSTENKQLKAQLQVFQKEAVINEASEGLTIIQQESLRELSESLLYVNKEQFKNRVLQLKEKFLSGKEHQTRTSLTESTKTTVDSNSSKSQIDVSKYVKIQTRK
jgi:hypothetical protein